MPELTPEKRAAMKSHLERIVEAHRLAKEAKAVEATAPTVVEDAFASQTPEQAQRAAEEEAAVYAPKSEEVKPEEEPEAAEEEIITPQTHPELFLTIRTPEVEDLVSAGTVYQVRTGRVVITHRRRRPDDDPNVKVIEMAPKLRQPDPSKDAAAYRDFTSATAGDDKQIWSSSNGRSRPARHIIVARGDR